MKKKIITILVTIIITFFGLNFIHNKILFLYGSKKNFVYKEFPKSAQLLIDLMINNKSANLKNINDYNIKFLPETQTIDLNLRKIKINNLIATEQGYKKNLKKKRFAFNFAKYKSFLLLASDKSNIFYLDIKDLDNDSIKINEISHNLIKDENYIRDILVHDDNIFVSIRTKINKNCKILEVYKSKVGVIQKLSFEKIFSNSECALGIEAGRMQVFQNDNKKLYLLITTAADILRKGDEYRDKPQNDSSIFGKIIQISLEDYTYNMFSKGHRNSLGLYVNNEEKVILQTENGPKGGDEINLIKKGLNYGWNIASYGTGYDNQNKKGDYEYKLSHKKYGYEEPIFAFVPSIGITEIIKIGKNFTNKWENNYIIGSLNSKHLYRVKFDTSYNKVLFFEKIFIGERMRDLFYLDDTNKILIAMEETGSIGIIENKNN